VLLPDEGCDVPKHPAACGGTPAEPSSILRRFGRVRQLPQLQCGVKTGGGGAVGRWDRCRRC
jgi:hypothetical protein